ncbi:MAG TPA: oligopeptide/dipeptide ABC transporter ATP-binding protein, partial [Gaiellales bacterium]
MSAAPTPTPTPTATPAPTLVVERLRVMVSGTGNDIVDDVSFTIAPGEVLGLVGESGSGKTTAALALLGHTRRGAEITGGQVLIGDSDVLKLDRAARRRLRGRVISYVPQDPAAALNPALRIGTQLMEALEVHGVGSGGEERRARVAEMMREVALPDDAAYLRRYPHELSGGQQQRIGLAMAFACRPRVIVLDEPTTGLDVTTQAHVLGTVRDLAAAHSVAALYVSHDLAVVGSLAARVAVMYAGRVVELAPAEELFRTAAHPYTRRLVAAVPHLKGRRELVGIPGRAPSPGQRPAGCAFALRCTMVEERCTVAMPELRSIAATHSARCVRAEEVRAQAEIISGSVGEMAEPDQADAVLELVGVNAGYLGVTVVHDINLKLAPQECLALVG